MIILLADVIARGRDFKLLNEADVVYFPAYGKLVPKEVTHEQLLSEGYRNEDPLKDVTYTVFRVGTRATRLDPTFNYNE